MLAKKMESNTKIHPTAIVHENAKIGDNVTIGAYSVIGEFVELKDNVEISHHVCIEGDTIIGQGTRIFPFAVIGFPPPDLKYRGEQSKLRIGENCVIREHANIHTGTAVDRNETTIGNNCLLMPNTHVAHDCIVGNNVIMANNATLGGHVTLEDNVILGGLAAVHQYCKIGAFAIIGGLVRVTNDVIPYATVTTDSGHLGGLNVVGMKRREMSKEDIQALNQAYKRIFQSDDLTIDARVAEVESQFKDNENVMRIVNFIKSERKMSLCLSR